MKSCWRQNQCTSDARNLKHLKMSITIPARRESATMQVPGANVSIALNWIALVSLLSLPFSFFTRAGRRRAHFAARGVRYSRLIASAASAGRFGDDAFLPAQRLPDYRTLAPRTGTVRKTRPRFFCMRRSLRISRSGARRSPLARAIRPRVLSEQVFGGHSCAPLLILDFDCREPDGPVGFAQARVWPGPILLR